MLALRAGQKVGKETHPTLIMYRWVNILEKKGCSPRFEQPRMDMGD